MRAKQGFHTHNSAMASTVSIMQEQQQILAKEATCGNL